MSSEGPNTPHHPVFASQLDPSVHNTLKKDPNSRQNATNVSTGPPRGRLVKSKPSGAADPDRLYEQQATQPTYSNSTSATNRLRKVPGNASSNISTIPSRSTGNSSGIPQEFASNTSVPANTRETPVQLRSSTITTSNSSQAPPPGTTGSASTNANTTNIPARPVPLRSQSYSKRHASFDTPREVPLPAPPPGVDVSDRPPTFDDSERETKRPPNDWTQSDKYRGPQSPMYGTGLDRNSRGDRLITPGKTPSFNRANVEDYFSIGYSTSQSLPSQQPPYLARNNSAPTPPHTPGVDQLVPKQHPSAEISDAGTISRSESSPGTDAGSVSDVSAQVDSSKDPDERGGGILKAIPDTEFQLPEERRKVAMQLLHEGRLSTASLPLPRSYAADRVSQLPPSSRLPCGTAGGASSSSGSGSEGGRNVATPTNAGYSTSQPEYHREGTQDSGLSEQKRVSLGALGYSVGTGVPPVLTSRLSELQSLDLVAPGTAWRSSGSAMRRTYGEDDDEGSVATAPTAIQHILKQPEIETPDPKLNPFLLTPNMTPSSTDQKGTDIGPSSTSATPGHHTFMKGPIPQTYHDPEGPSNKTSPKPNNPSGSNSTVDRDSTASGSSGASSDPNTYPDLHSSNSDIPDHPKAISGDNAQPSISNTPEQVTGNAKLPDSSAPSVHHTPLMTVDTTPSAYILEASLPGYQRDEITLSTRKKRILHVVADGFVSGGGHFERRISFGYDADMARIRAEFNGFTLKITVPRRPTPQTFAASIGASAASTGTGSSFSTGGSMFSRGRTNML
ncbi:hypothetical protein CPB86DRAFT_733028 [Serendipita vermifera]|nr:hypothetical protein CPB86DRAFT_733028 [Serendipita vermifera]